MLKHQVEFVREDERGKLIQVATLDGKQLNIFEIKKGAQLGGHFHKETREIFYVLDGWISVWSYKRPDPEAIQTEFFKGDAFEIVPLEWHAIEALYESRLVVLLSQPYNKESPDIHTGEL